MSESRNDVDHLTVATRKALELCDAANAAIKARDKALNHLVGLVGGDRLSAIGNSQRRIGELITEVPHD